MSALYQRSNNSKQGRHLIATKHIAKDTLIFAERPLLALQSLENRTSHQVCHGCMAFVGGPKYTLQRRKEIAQRIDNWTDTKRCPAYYHTKCQDTIETELNGMDVIETNEDPTTIVPCRRRECGHIYCSMECEQDTWTAHHYCLCTAHCTEDDPLTKFKQFAVETNEILLLVAEWWIAQHTVMAVATGQQEQHPTPDNPYIDFVMNPWWDVLALEVVAVPGGFGETAVLQQSLRYICEEAARLLSTVFQQHNHQHLPPITAIDVAVRIGACEQNAMGIRQRSPLCRDIFDSEVRQQCHEEIIHCLQENDYIGNDNNDVDAVKEETGDEIENIDEETEIWDYSVDEIASYLSNLRMDEDGSVLDTAGNKKSTDLVETIEENDNVENFSEQNEWQNFDDLDIIFPPLDGTAMYSIACKMNHSCDPNVILIYKARTGWGRRHPLTAFVVALREIEIGDELTISYIDAEQPLAERQKALTNYGFQCQCNKCQMEEHEGQQFLEQHGDTVVENDPFGSDSDVDADVDNDIDILPDENERSDSIDGETLIQRRLDRLDTIANHSRFGKIPMDYTPPLTAFLLQTTASLSTRSDLDHAVAMKLLNQCTEAIKSNDYCMSKIAGIELECILFTILKGSGRWPSTSYREAYWCACLASALGMSHDYDFWNAQNILDKAMILGLPNSDNRIKYFVAFVENHASEVCLGPYLPGFSVNLQDLRDTDSTQMLHEQGLSQRIAFPVPETTFPVSFDLFQSQYVSRSQAVVIRGLAADWIAVTKWRNLQYFAQYYGHRLVPVELGSMLESRMNEVILTVRQFVQRFLLHSAFLGCWNLSDCSNNAHKIAYLAQHPLVDQISLLRADLDMNPSLFSPMRPTHVNLWIGTGGTRTPLHFDSYDNLFVQLVGAKYMRLYRPDATQYLYVMDHEASRGGYGLQGNMSHLDCEQEDYAKHPLARSATYTEVLLLPGDAIYIPARVWHYARSLTTSISINYWY